MTNIQKTINSLMSEDQVKKRFNEILGTKAPGFISSVISATKSNSMLLQADPNSILSAAVVAATLDLPIDANLGFAAIVPYRDKNGTIIAQFQMMYKGYIQLAQRSGQYATINACEIYEGELISENRVTGEYVFDFSAKKSDKIVGFAAYFRLLNGFEKTMFITVEAMTKHGKRFSQSFKKGYGLWSDDFDSMAIKTVLKRILSKYGVLSIQMQQAIKFDQLAVTEDGEAEYIDVTNQPNIDLEDAKARTIEAPKSELTGKIEFENGAAK